MGLCLAMLERSRPGLFALWIGGLAALALCGVTGGAVAAPKERYAAIVVDNKSGKILFSRNANDARYPASLVKIMTLYMVFDALDADRLSLDSRLKTSARASRQSPSKVGLKRGQTIKVSDAIRALVTKSANDVAVVIAEKLGGTEDRFAKLMTQKARELGMTRTVFRNASGLPNAKQSTTARDMAILARRVMEDFDHYYEYFSLKYFTYRGKRYRNHNELLFSYKGTDGIKTGYIRSSGFNVVISARRTNKHLIAVVMGGKTAKARNAHARMLLDKSFPKATFFRTRAKTSRAPSPPKRNPSGATTAVLPWTPGVPDVAPRPKPSESWREDAAAP